MRIVAARWSVVITAGVMALACATFGRPGPTPAPLVGQWLDVARTTPGDSSIWVLAASGSDDIQHIRGGERSRRHYGLWYLSGDLADTANRALCFTSRPGRNGSTCVRFDLDTVVTEAAGRRRRLTLREYHGGGRVLLEYGA